jgi:hypothetical protein
MPTTAARHIAKTETNIGSVNTLGGIVTVSVVVIFGDGVGVDTVLAVVMPGIDGGADAILYLGLSVHYLDRIMYARRRLV